MLKKFTKNFYVREQDNLSNDYSMVEEEQKINFIFTKEYKLNVRGKDFTKPVTEIEVDKEKRLLIIRDIFEVEENKDFIMSIKDYQAILSIINETIYLSYYDSVHRTKNVTISNIAFGDNRADIYAYLGTELMTVHHIAEITGGDTSLLLNKCVIVNSIAEAFPHSFDDIEGVVIVSENRYYSNIELTPSTILLYENSHLPLKDVFNNPTNYEFIYKNNLVGIREKGKCTYTYNGEACNIDKAEENQIRDLITTILTEFEQSINQEFNIDDDNTIELVYNKIRTIKLDLTDNELIQKYNGIEIIDFDAKQVVRLDKELLDNMNKVLDELHKEIEFNI